MGQIAHQGLPCSIFEDADRCQGTKPGLYSEPNLQRRDVRLSGESSCTESLRVLEGRLLLQHCVCKREVETASQHRGTAILRCGSNGLSPRPAWYITIVQE
jgi:hypothetical protein